MRVRAPSLLLTRDTRPSGAKANTGNYEHRFFRVPSGEEVPEAVGNDVTWQSWTSVLGQAVTGIWPKESSDKGDINCAHLSGDGRKLVTGDDFGLVKLFDFPADKPSVKTAMPALACAPNPPSNE